MENNQLLAIILDTIINQGPIKEEYIEFTHYINLLGKRIKNNTIPIEEVGCLKSCCTFLNTSESIMGHILTKPFGYAGDFKIIDRIYTYDTSTMFPKWDSFALSNSAAQAVRNRKEYFKKIVVKI